jgi:hypothetical protein
MNILPLDATSTSYFSVLLHSADKLSCGDWCDDYQDDTCMHQSVVLAEKEMHSIYSSLSSGTK